MKTKTEVALLAGVLALSPLCVVAQDVIGRVLLTRGDVSARAVDGSIRQLARRDEVFEQDTLLTGPDAYASVRLNDDGQLTLAANSEFKFEIYRFDGNPATPDAAIMTLLAGCFRTVSGQIGDSPGDQHRIDTPVASIAIRGTLHAASYDGEVLYTATYEGGTTVSSAEGNLDVGMGGAYDYSRTLPGAAPEGLVDEPDFCAPPPVSSQSTPTGGDFSAGP